jgi:phospholipid N-methyltransferase
MSRRLSDRQLFWRQFRENFRATGAVLPSGRRLAAALARHVGQGSGPQRVLEVGPGTGAVTAQIVRRLRPDDVFDLVELNAAFVDRLRQRFAEEPAFQAVAARSRVLHQRVETLTGGEPYDLIVSGLPLNNFAVAEVEQILCTLRSLLRPGGTLSFFEYIAIRSVKSLVSTRAERARLCGIGRLLAAERARQGATRDWVWPNVPPAWVHHVRPSG